MHRQWLHFVNICWISQKKFEHSAYSHLFNQLRGTLQMLMHEKSSEISPSVNRSNTIGFKINILINLNIWTAWINILETPH